MFPLSEIPIYQTIQYKFATNLPISFTFNFWPGNMSREHKYSLMHKKASRSTFEENFIFFSWLC